MAFVLKFMVHCKPADDIFSIKFTPDSSALLAACTSGSIKVIDMKHGREAGKITPPNNAPVISLRFPSSASPVHPSVSGVLLVGCSDGQVLQWSVVESRWVHSMKEEGNEVYAVDYNCHASLYATAGSDRHIRIYNNEKGELVQTLGTRLDGHMNRCCLTQYRPPITKTANFEWEKRFNFFLMGYCRIAALRWNDLDPNLIATGSWDKSVRLWDIRQPPNKPYRTMFGPFISGESLDYMGTTILTGACRLSDQIELWDTTTGKQMSAIQWPTNDEGNRDEPMLYACQFSRKDGGKYIAAGGSFTTEARVFSTASRLSCGGIIGLNSIMYSCDFAPTTEEMAFAGQGGNVVILNYSPNGTGPTKVTLLRPPASEIAQQRKSPLRARLTKT